MATVPVPVPLPDQTTPGHFQTISLKDFLSNLIRTDPESLPLDNCVRYWLAGIKASGIGPTGTVFAIGLRESRLVGSVLQALCLLLFSRYQS